MATRPHREPGSMCANVAAVILARGGSKGVAGKNLRKIGGISLVGRSVRAAMSADRVDRVYVSTDDAEIAKEAELHGAQIINRPAELSEDISTSESGWLHALTVIRLSQPDVSGLVLLQCTSPFTTGAEIDGCLQAMEQSGAACSLAVIPNHSFLWAYGDNGYGIGVNHDETQQRQRRQDLAPEFRESGAIYCVRVNDFERTGQRFCGPVALYPIEHPPLEIDTDQDLVLCRAYEQQCERLESALIDKLKDVRAVIMDFDGVHTNDTALVDETGKESVIVSRRDGLGIERLRRAKKWRLLILSKEKNAVVMRRAEKLGIECMQGEDDKLRTLQKWIDTERLDWKEILYVGNDLNDLQVLAKVGVSVCPLDADPSVIKIVDWIVPVAGGGGVLRAISDQLLEVANDDSLST